MPRDRFDREIDYLRISLTDHCNLRCVYCMPLSAVRYSPGEDVLSASEIERVARAAASVGFRKVRLTGGEPTLRKDLVEIVRRIAAVDGIEDVAMTTNGILLPSLATELKSAGLRRVNVHIDAIDPDRLSAIMRWGKVEEIWKGILAAEEAGLTPIKLNCVIARGYNEDQAVPLARLALERDWHVRFIELMPLGGGECAQVAVDAYVPNPEIRAAIESELGALRPLPRTNPADESVNYALAEGRGVIGFISPVSAPYCGNCNRMRLTSDGRFHLCLLNDDELDVRAALRREANESELGDILIRAVGAKPTGHSLADGISTETRWMHHIGG